MKARARISAPACAAAGGAEGSRRVPSRRLAPTDDPLHPRPRVNDPHGVIRRDGLYHVFYQANRQARKGRRGSGGGTRPAPIWSGG